MAALTALSDERPMICRFYDDRKICIQAIGQIVRRQLSNANDWLAQNEGALTSKIAKDNLSLKHMMAWINLSLEYMSNPSINR